MTQRFKSPRAFAAHLAKLAAAMPPALHAAADKWGQLIVDTAHAEIGNPDMYDPRMAGGPFSAWPELLPQTELDKVRQGYPADAPLLRKGDMRDSFSHNTESEGLVHTTVAGSTDPTLIFHEHGTVHMEPRPVLGPAVFMNKTNIEAGLGVLIYTLVSGKSWKRHLLTNWRKLS